MINFMYLLINLLASEEFPLLLRTYALLLSKTLITMLRKLLLLSGLASASAFTSLPAKTALPTALFGEDDAVSASMGAEAISALTSNVKTVFSLEDIAKILPHRYPFLLVDKVVEYEEGKVSFILLELQLISEHVFHNADALRAICAPNREPLASNP